MGRICVVSDVGTAYVCECVFVCVCGVCVCEYVHTYIKIR
jgi:hypothetical protein